MKRRYAILIGIALGFVGSLVGFATVARTAPEPQRYGPPIGPRMAKDTGPGELLLAVVGGVYETKEQADAANEQLRFGDLQGYYVVPVGQFAGFREQLGEPGEFALVTVFRTEEGAAEFVGLATSVGYPATLLPERVHSFGGAFAGLGQETNPQGTGPLLGPVPESLPVAEVTPTPEPPVEDAVP
jgi:hypothetical protein